MTNNDTGLQFALCYSLQVKKSVTKYNFLSSSLGIILILKCILDSTLNTSNLLFDLRMLQIHLNILLVF